MVLGEAEANLPPFLRNLTEGRPQRAYRSEHWPDMAMSPVPEWDLVRMDRYAAMCLQYSRGCPFDCDFCDIGLLNGRRPRTKEESLVECNKVQNRGRDLLDAVRRMQRAGLQVMGDFIVGFDSDPPTIFQHQARFIFFQQFHP